MRLPRLSPRAYQRITLLALFALGLIIVTGAAVRLTGSGLGCPQWPTCSEDQVVAPLETHAWIEFGNRLLTGVVSAAVIVAVLGSLVRQPRRRDLTWWSLGLVVGVVAQIVVGGMAVIFGLAPIYVTVHFLLSIALVWNAMVLHERASSPPTPAVLLVPEAIRNLGRAMVAASLVVLVFGTVVTGAGPHAGDRSAPRYEVDLTEATRFHSITAWLFLGLTLVTLWQLHRSGAPAQVDRRGRLLVGAILAQGALGYAQYAAGLPPYLVLVHVLGSVLVFVATLHFHFGLFTHPADTEPAVDPTTGSAATPGGTDPVLLSS